MVSDVHFLQTVQFVLQNSRIVVQLLKCGESLVELLNLVIFYILTVIKLCC